MDNSPNSPTHWLNIQTQSSGLRWAVIGYSVRESARSTTYCHLVCSESFAYTKSMPSKYSNRIQWVEVNCYWISLSRSGEQCQSCVVGGWDACVNLARCSHIACMGVISLLMWDAFKGAKKHASKVHETALPFYIVCEVQIFDEKETVCWKWTCCGMTSLWDVDFDWKWNCCGGTSLWDVDFDQKRKTCGMTSCNNNNIYFCTIDRLD